MKKFNLSEPIFVVDDESEVCEVLAEACRKMGFVTHEFASASLALEQLAQARPFLILSDFRMSGLNGFDFCREIRKIAPNVPVVIITGHADKDVVVNGLKAGISELLEKPINIETLQNLVSGFAEKRIQALEAEKQELDEILPFFIEESFDMLSDFDQLVLRLEQVPVDAAVIDSLFRKIHSIKGGAASLPNAQLLAAFSHDFESALSQIKKGEFAPTADCISLFLESHDIVSNLLRALSERHPPSVETENLIEVTRARLSGLKAAKGVSAAPPPTAAKVATPESSPEDEGIWVTNDKLDSFMKVSGELIALKNNFDLMARNENQLSLEKLERKMTDFAQELNKLTDHLQEEIMSVRKVSLERTFSKVPRIVRQTAQGLNKKVRLQTQGLEIGIDKNLATALSASIMHLVRNSLDHGLETPEKRKALGKPEEGTVTIEANEAQGMVLIKLSDDGAGIDAEKVLNKAIQNGTVTPQLAQTMKESDIFDLIFLPGLSTKAEVTEISGRGVGMDVVKSSLAAHNGRIRITSKKGVGTTFHLELPIPKSVMVERTVLARSGQSIFALPLVAVARIISCKELTLTHINGTRACQFDGSTVPLQSYSELTGFSAILGDEELSHKTAVVVQRKNEYFALLIDAIEGQLEAVIRPFDSVVQSLPGLSGTTVLGTEEIAYVVDPETLLKMAYNQAA